MISTIWILKNIFNLFPLSQFIPMPVLYGVLLYMGVSSLKGMQLVDRILLMMMPPKYQPDYIYLRHVPLTKVHLFILVQVGLAKYSEIQGVLEIRRFNFTLLPKFRYPSVKMTHIEC